MSKQPTVLDALNAMSQTAGMLSDPNSAVRSREPFGDVTLSIVAGPYWYSKPDAVLPVDQYESVEVGIIRNGELTRPEVVGLGEFADLFEAGDKPVAGYVSQADVQRMRDVLTARAKGA